MKKLVLTLLKVGISLAIVAYLIRDAHQNQVFEQLSQQAKNWWLLAAAAVSCFGAVMLTLIRWYYLVRAVGIPITFREALRMGFIGYLYNLAPLGIVGGDLLKAVMLAREHKGHRPEAVASVFFDRLIGLYLLFAVATVAILFSGLMLIPNAVVDGVSIQTVCWVTLGITLGGTVLMAALFVPAVTKGRWVRELEKRPYGGHTLARLIGAVGMYRHNVPVLIASVVMTLGVHGLNSLGIYLMTRGLYSTYPPLSMQFVIMPLSAATGVIPLSFGPFEVVLNLLFVLVPLPGGGQMVRGQGLVVALGYRIVTVLTAMVGLAYYLGARRELAEALSDAEHEEHAAQEELEQSARADPELRRPRAASVRPAPVEPR